MIRRIYYFSLYILTSTAAIMTFYLVNQDKAFAVSFFKEGGPIEQITPVLFLIASLLAGISFIKHQVNLRFVFTLAMALATMRELDWHKAWTTDSVLKSRFYLNDITPLYEKIIGGGVILLLLYIAVSLAWKVKPWLQNLLQGQLLSWSIFFALSSMVGAKMLDSMVRLFPFTADIKTDNAVMLIGIEETMELVSASLFIFTALLLLRMKIIPPIHS